MAEPPSSDRRRPPPPPVPPLPRRAGTPPPLPEVARKSAPAASAAVPVATGDEEVAEPTRPARVPDRAGAVEELSEQVAREVEAMVTGRTSEGSEETLADLNLRMALFAWDVLEDPAGSRHQLELAARHPLASSLLLGHALGGGKPALLENVQAQLERQLADGAADARRTAAML